MIATLSSASNSQTTWPGSRPSLCSLLMWMASDSYHWLHDGFQHHAPPPGEETLTDVHIRHLRQAMGNRVKAIQFNKAEESRNGADWELWIHNQSHGVGLRIQAKRENQTGQYGFDHWLKEQNALQCDLLIHHASRTQCLPVYLLYNHQYWGTDRRITNSLCSHTASDHSHHGASLVSARQVQAQLFQPRISHIRIRNSSLPWNQVLCDRRVPVSSHDPSGFGMLQTIRRTVDALGRFGREVLESSAPAGLSTPSHARGGTAGLQGAHVPEQGAEAREEAGDLVARPLPEHVRALMDNHTGWAAEYPVPTRCAVLYDITEPPESQYLGFGDGCVRVR